MKEDKKDYELDWMTTLILNLFGNLALAGLIIFIIYDIFIKG